MNIAFCISDLGCGGAQRVLINVLKKIKDSNFNVYVITLYDESTDHYKLPDEVKRIVVGYTKNDKGVLKAIYYNLIRLFMVRKNLKKYKIQHAMSFIGVMNVLLVIATIKLNVRTIISERNDPEKQLLGVPWNYFRKKLYRYSDTVTANSNSALKTMSSYVPSNKLFYLPNPFPEVNEACVNRQYQYKKKIKLLAVGRLHKQKNYENLLKALSYCVMNSDYDYTLTILGDGPLYGELTSLCVELKVDRHVVWKKNVLDTEKYYIESDIYLLPSLYEGMPNSLLEAMSYQLPAIVSNSTDTLKEIIQDNINGLLVNACSSDEIAEKIILLSEKPELRKSLSLSAMGYIKSCDNQHVLNLWKSLFK